MVREVIRQESRVLAGRLEWVCQARMVSSPLQAFSSFCPDQNLSFSEATSDMGNQERKKKKTTFLMRDQKL